jgi:hypothetical protein
MCREETRLIQMNGCLEHPVLIYGDCFNCALCPLGGVVNAEQTLILLRKICRLDNRFIYELFQA